MCRKLFILAEARSGSSWLRETLDFHPDIVLQSELFNQKMFEEVKGFKNMEKKNFLRCTNYLEKKIAELAGEAESKYTGCKILIPQLHFISKDFCEYFIEYYKDACFIFLYRENMVAAQVSLKIARAYNHWHSLDNEDIKKRRVHIDIDWLFRRLERVRLLRERTLKQLEKSGVKKFPVSYEALFKNKKKSARKIHEFLGVPVKNHRFSSEKKGNPFSAKQVMENFAEVKDFFKKYNYYKMLLKS